MAFFGADAMVDESHPVFSDVACNLMKVGGQRQVSFSRGQVITELNLLILKPFADGLKLGLVTGGVIGPVYEWAEHGIAHDIMMHNNQIGCNFKTL